MNKIPPEATLRVAIPAHVAAESFRRKENFMNQDGQGTRRIIWVQGERNTRQTLTIPKPLPSLILQKFYYFVDSIIEGDFCGIHCATATKHLHASNAV